MPLGFPSHQGLLAPLWRLWPGRWSILALWAGALAPDVVDGAASLAVRGRFGQWFGHSLVGATLVGVPLALALTAALRRGARRLAGGEGLRHRIARRIAALDGPGRLRDEAASAWIGALSHVLFDLFSHERSRVLWPFAPDPAWLGDGWHTVWFHVSVPGYPAYPIGPHFVGWLVLTVAGAVMFLRWPPRTR